MTVKRGDIFYADLSPVVGSEQGGIRPVLIIQNDVGNRYSPTVICAAITSQINKAKLPTHIEIDCCKYSLVKDSVVLLEQIRTIDKKRLREKIGHLDGDLMRKINKSLLVSIGLLYIYPILSISFFGVFFGLQTCSRSIVSGTPQTTV